MQIIAYQIFAFGIAVITVAIINLISNKINKRKENEKPAKYLGATDEDVDRLLDTLCEESCYYPFDHFEDAL